MGLKSFAKDGSIILQRKKAIKNPWAYETNTYDKIMKTGILFFLFFWSKNLSKGLEKGMFVPYFEKIGRNCDSGVKRRCIYLCK